MKGGSESRSEKPARSALFTAVKRLLGMDTIVIIDGPNYIKGFRYQIYCAAREVGVRTCTAHIVATPEMCRNRNASRDPGSKYLDETLENLLVRYEEPSSTVRWDTPLFVIPWDEEIPGDAIFQAVTSGVKKPPNQGVVQISVPPKDALQTLEQTTNTVANLIMSAQSSGTVLGGPLIVALPSSSTRIEIILPNRTLTLSELQRHKRHFVTIHKKAISTGMAGRAEMNWTEETVAQKFASHLEENLR